jgi:CBS-domain-containing membrane protein
MRHTTVADVMSTNVISARPQDSFAHLTTLLRGAAIRAVPVVDDDGTLLGVVSEADLMAAVARPLMATRPGGGGVLGTSAVRPRNRRRARPQRPSS